MMSHIAVVVGVSALVICTPGPDTALTIRNTLCGGYRSGLGAAAGVALGQLLWAVAAGVGLACLLRASRPAFDAVQLAGAVYLLILGIQSWRAAIGGVEHDAQQVPARTSVFRAVGQGLINDLANPKMAVFFLSLLPQLAPSGDLGTYTLLGVIFALMTLSWLSVYALFLHRARAAFLRGRARRVLEAACGTVLTALGVQVAADVVRTA